MIFSIEMVATLFAKMFSPKSERLRLKFYFEKMLTSFPTAKTRTGRTAEFAVTHNTPPN
jgi:hypothetical protein